MLLELLLTGGEYAPEFEGIEEEREDPVENDPLLPVLLKLLGSDL